MAGGKSWILGRYGGDGGCSLGCQQSHDSEDSDDDTSYNGDNECVISCFFAFSLSIIIK